MVVIGRLCKFEPQDWAYNRGRWWEQFIDDISIELLEDICHQVRAFLAAKVLLEMKYWRQQEAICKSICNVAIRKNTSLLLVIKARCCLLFCC